MGQAVPAPPVAAAGRQARAVPAVVPAAVASASVPAAGVLVAPLVAVVVTASARAVEPVVRVVLAAVPVVAASVVAPAAVLVAPGRPGGPGGRRPGAKRSRKSKRAKRQEFDNMEAPTIGGVRIPRGDGRTVRLPRGASLTDFAEKIDANPGSLVQALFGLGEMVTATQSRERRHLAVARIAS
ncbi:MAG: hypothetical protein V9G10_16995 [Candidatus Nanopelagicales bacterium]